MFSLVSESEHLRTIVMVAVTLICILPLGMLKNVDSLSTVCAASIGFYVCLVIKIVLESQAHILNNDWTGEVLYWQPAGVLQCLPIFSMALSCQMQLFEVFKSVHNQSLEKLNGIVRNATWICTLVYIAVGFFGYVAFCTETFAGNILINFSPSFGSDVIKIGFVLSVAFSFPLVIFPCRASIYSLLYRKGQTESSSTGGYIPESRFRAITVFIVIFALCIALLIPSVELVIGLVGSTIGVAICVMFPAACFRSIVKKASTERSLAQFILCGGFCLMILGTYANLNAIDAQHSGAHLELPQLNEQFLEAPTTQSAAVEDLKILKEKLKIVNDEENYKYEMKKAAEMKLPVEAAVDHQPKEPEKVPESAAEMKETPKLSPPLPVDEKHEKEEQMEAANVKVNLATIKVEQKKQENQKQLSMQQQLPAKNSLENAPVLSSTNADNSKPKANNATQQQNIDRAALKEADNVAAEELKVNNEAAANSKDDELKKAKNELKETKELFARAVDELKEELAKKNVETQNLVVEKLGEVVEKVEQIERKVQAKEIAENKSAELLKVAQSHSQQQPAPPQMTAEPHLLNSKAAAAKTQPEKVYEPLSYVAGELLQQQAKQNKQNNSIFEQRLPLPLALLINATSLMQKNDTIKQQQQAKLQETLQNVLPPAAQKEPKPLQIMAAANATQVTAKLAAKEQIRPEERFGRDLLQLKPEVKAAEITTPAADMLNAVEQRSKRSIETQNVPNFEAINVKLAEQSILNAPKLESLVAHGANVAHNIGLDLKALLPEEKDEV